jgi:TP901 family phage tail tape measure protein
MSEGLLPPVIASLVADTKEFTAKMGEARGEMDSLGKKGASTSSIMSAGFLGVGAAVGAVAIGIAAESIHMAEGYQTSLTQIREQTHMTAGQIKNISNAFFATAGTAEYSASAIASAYLPVSVQLQALEGHALSGKQAMSVMNGAMDLAATKNVSLADATSNVVALMKAYQVPLKNVGQLTNEMYQGSNLAGMSLDTYAASMTKLHARLGVTMPSLKDMNLMMTDMTLHGIGTGRSLLQVTSAMQSLMSPTKANKQVISELLPNLYNANGQFEGMKNVIGTLSGAFSHMTTQQQIATATTIFGKSAAQSMVQVIDAGIPSWNKASAAIKNSGNVSQAAALQHKTLHGELQTLGATADTLGTELGVTLLGDVTKVTGWMAGPGVKDLRTFMKEFDSKSPKTFAGQLGGAFSDIKGYVGQLVKGTGDRGPNTAANSTHNLLGAGWSFLKSVGDLGLSLGAGAVGHEGAASRDWGASARALSQAGGQVNAAFGATAAPIKIAPGPLDTQLPTANSHLGAMQGTATQTAAFVTTSNTHLSAIKGTNARIDGSTHDSAVHLANIASKIGQRDHVNITVKVA